MHIRTKNSWIKHLDFIIVDLLCLNATFLFAYFLRNRGISNMYAEREYRMIVIVAIILHFCISFFSNYYSGILKRGYFQEFKKVVIHNAELAGLLFGFMFIITSMKTCIMSSFFITLFNIILWWITINYTINYSVD